MPITLRPITLDELDQADALLVAAYGPENRRRRFQRCLEVQPDGWWFAMLKDEPVGMGGAIDYGDIAYLGMMAVHPRVQRQGIGTAVLQQVLDWLDHRGCLVILLEATDAGAPLYARAGFVEEGRTRKLVHDDCALRPRISTQITPYQRDDLSALASFDASIFGARRDAVLGSFLADYADRAFVARDEAGAINGYLVAQEQTIGPWVAHTPQIAEGLLAYALQLEYNGQPQVFVPGASLDATTLLLQYGFSPRASLHHMRRGRAAPGQRALLYGQCNYAMG